MRILAAFAGLLSLATGGATPAAASEDRFTGAPRTLLTVDDVSAFAQDGDRLAWVRAPGGLGGRVEVLGVRRQTRTVIARLGPEDVVVGFALAGSQAVLVDLEGGVCSNSGCYFDMLTTSLRTRRLSGIGATNYEDWTVPPVAGDGETLVYFWHCSSSEECGSGPDAIYRVSRGRTFKVVDSGFPVGLAASGGRIAIAERTTTRIDRGKPTWSPDGNRIAFARTQHDWSGSEWALVEAGTGIYVRDVGGGGETRLIAGQTTALDWSTDGRLVFARPTSLGYGHDEIYVANSDGSGERPLTSGASPVWSPDGAKIAFTGDEDVYIVNADGSGLKSVSKGVEAAWSPDGKRLAVATYDGIKLIGLDSDSASPLRGVSGRVWDLDWSPDGSRVAFSDWWNEDQDEAGIFIANVDGSRVRRVVPPGGFRAESGDAHWSPNGAEIAFARGVPDFVYPGEPVPDQLYVTKPDGTGTRRLTSPSPRRSTVSIRTAVGGKLVTRFDVKGDVTALALSPSLAAALVRKEAALRIELRDARTGALRRTARVPRTTTWNISIAGTTVVFRTGRTIRLLDGSSGRVSLLTTTASTPIGLSIEGRRVAWAENVDVGERNEGRIRALTLGRR